MYTQSCYIKTKGQELIDNLSLLGYIVKNEHNIDIENNEFYLMTIPLADIPEAIILPIDYDKTFFDNSFDCKDSEKSFLGIAEMQDDTDKNQYFVDEEGASWVNLGMWIEPGSLSRCLVDKKVQCFNSPKEHRASPEEILNYFLKNPDSNYGRR